MKEVKIIPHKFYFSIDDARDDFKCSLVGVECEGSVQPNEAKVAVDVSSFKILNMDEVYLSNIEFSVAIFKLKTLKRETIFGTFFEKVYIFHNYIEDTND